MLTNLEKIHYILDYMVFIASLVGCLKTLYSYHNWSTIKYDTLSVIKQFSKATRKMKNRIDGRRLAQNIGEEVILLGTIGKKSSSGRNLEVRTTDGIQVNVTLPEPIDDDAEGYIEVQGILQSKSTLNCTNYIVFPPSMTEDFDAEQYNELMVILHVLGSEKWKLSEDDPGF